MGLKNFSVKICYRTIHKGNQSGESDNRWKHIDVDRNSQEPIDVKLGQLARARAKKLKLHEENEANGMVSYIEEALRKKLEEFEGLEKTSKLFLICTISKDHSGEQIGGKNGKVLE